VTRHEPWSALDGGEGTGSAMLLDICRAAVGMLRPGGFLALETGGVISPTILMQVAC
jgi:methylase of polypeptide subunit release factors